MGKLCKKINVLIIGIILAGSLSGQVPVNPNASAEAKELLKFLYDAKGNGIITGNHNEQQYPTEWDDKLKAKNGNVEPAMYGNDFRYGGYIQYRQDVIDEIIRQHTQKGKIITMMYHQVRPMDAETEGWSNVQGELTWSEFESLLTDGDPIHEAWEDKMDNIAYYLQQLEDQKIPVLFRPYHEMNGEWFWWGGKKSGDQYKRLFRMTYDYLTTTKGLNNLLWVINYSNVNDDLSSYYPGDAYVDAIATDIYEASFTTNHYNALKNLANGKPIAVGEVGKMINMSELQSTYPDYVWFMGWRSLFVDNNTTSELTNVFGSNWAINTFGEGSVGNDDPSDDPANDTYTSLLPLDDTYADESKPTTSFGSADDILIKGDQGNYDREGYFKFDVSTCQDISKAVLRLYCNSNSGSVVDHSVFGIDDDAWSESSLTWDNRPQSTSVAIATTDVASAGAYYEWDVTNYVLSQTDGAVSFALINESDLLVKVLFSSKEASSNQPELAIYTSSDTSGDPTDDGTNDSMVSLPYLETFDAIGGEFIANDNTTNWESPTIDISTVSSVDITMDYIEEGELDASGDWLDFVKIYTSVDGGSNTLAKELYGASGFSTISIGNISGTTLKIIIEGHTTSSSETYIIDNLNVAEASGDDSTNEDGSGDTNSTLEIEPIADAYVSKSSSSVNYGFDTELYIKGDAPYGSYDREGYLKFDVSGFEQITEAILRLYCTSNNYGTIDHAAFGIDDDSWSEGGITWSNAPAISNNPLATTNVSGAGAYYEWDLTSYVSAQADGLVSVALINETDDMGKVYFATKENGANAPKLKVTGTTTNKSGKLLGNNTPEVTTKVDMQLYPNPTNGKFIIDLSGTVSPFSVTIFNLTGKEVYRTKPLGTGKSITLYPQLPAGVYLIRVVSNEHQLSKTLIVK